MTDHRAFFFAVRRGCEPVLVPNKSAHALLHWAAKGHEVFEVRWSDEWDHILMAPDEQYRLYDLLGDNVFADSWAVMSAAQAIRDRVAALIRAKTEQTPNLV
ncbi:hypothetical protein [Tabrizicola soli]|uniref:Uncharacterized protein n=1 Tax=Tabrizicola soli TaxID=2185115 RepID=A0ABV7E2D9_9RHOB